MINVLIMVLVVLLAVGAGAGYLYRNKAIQRGRTRAEQAFNRWRQLFFYENNFNKRMLILHRDVLAPGEYLYYQALVKEYYERNPDARETVPDNIILVTEDDDAPKH